ncbi:MAG: hypothetical protein IPN76_19535 [Saprospiraceae bacterium]|nr:hypothetical protein [Saprospiraceae bacterium]
MMELQQHFQNIRQLIRQAKSDAWEAVNTSFVSVRWQIGGYLSLKLNEANYGAKVVDSLAVWLRQQDPELQGFDRRSLYRMRQFFETWHHLDFEDMGIANKHVLPLVGSLSSRENTAIEIVGSLTPQLTQLQGILPKQVTGC